MGLWLITVVVKSKEIVALYNHLACGNSVVLYRSGVENYWLLTFFPYNLNIYWLTSFWSVT